MGEKCFMCGRDALHECAKCGRMICEMDSYSFENDKVCPICRTTPAQVNTLIEILR